MSTVFNVVEGQTSAIDIALKADGAVPSGTLAGTIDLILKNNVGTQLAFTGDVAILSAADWTVRISPDAGDFIAGSYKGRIKVTDGAGKIAFFPDGLWDIWKVRTEA